MTTGISAADRAVTVQAAVAPHAKAADLVQPGHIFPLMAQDGGVLTRAGHTEAGCDLARLAGFEPASVIVEILNEDGTMARRPDLEIFAEQHGIKLGTIADLIEYRNQHETTVEKVAECKLPTEYGEFDLVTFRDTIDNQVHFALKKGDVKADQPTLVRVHLHDVLSDLLLTDRHSARSWPLPKSMARIADEGGVLVILGRKPMAPSCWPGSRVLKPPTRGWRRKGPVAGHLAPGRRRFPDPQGAGGRQDAPIELSQEVPCPRWLWSGSGGVRRRVSAAYG